MSADRLEPAPAATSPAADAAPAGSSRARFCRRLRRTLLAITVAWLVACAVVAITDRCKALPAGLGYDGPPIAISGDQIRFLADLTYRDAADEPVHQQRVFDAMLAIIDHAEQRLVLDLFLFNPYLGAGGTALRPLSAELTAALMAARRRRPQLAVTLITDPLNDVYGGAPSTQLAVLTAAGVAVIRTDLDRLHDSNPAWSAPWRLVLGWWGNDDSGGWLPHPLAADGLPVTLRSWLTLLNFKANHRKVVVADDDAGSWRVLVTSLNPHDGSSAHSNGALEVRDARLARQVLAAENAVAAFSGGSAEGVGPGDTGVTDPGADHTVRYLTENAIRDALVAALDSAGPGDDIEVAVFYLSHAAVLDALVAAADRGARVRVVLDPNRDAFGHAKSGIPNRQSARRLMAAHGPIAVRWYQTHGEQFHPKLLLVRSSDRCRLLLGSANFTRRNLDAYNLEADLEVTMPRGAPLDHEVAAWFERIWSNYDGSYTVSYDAYRDDSRLRRLIAWWQERTGMGTF